MAAVPKFDPVGLVTLREIRTFIRRSHARGGVVFFGLLYVLGSLFLGGMVVLGDFPGGYTTYTVWGGTAGAWNYPGLLIEAPWGVVSLPFFATFAMIVVGVGVGYGMAVAFLLAIQLLKSRATRANGSSAAGAFAGLTPAMISLVTLGACCSTTAAATAGVGLVAQASGTSASNLLLNNRYLGVFQIGMVWVALLAQEMLLVVYRGLFGPSPSELARAPAPRRVDRRFVAAGVLRVVLLGAGLVWALAVLAEWTTVNPATAGAGYWFQWLVQHELVAGLAISYALFPAATGAILVSWQRGAGWVLSLALLVGGLSLMLWVPPPLPAWGLDGLVNQILGAAGAPANWGAIAPGPVGGLALYLRWGFEYVLLGGFAAVAALAPRRVLDWFSDPASVPSNEPVTSDLPTADPASVARATDPLGANPSHPETP